MQTELLINIIILSVVGTLLTLVISVRIYVSCCKPDDNQTQTIEDFQTIEPQIEIKEQELSWIPIQNVLAKNQQCCICLDHRIDTVTKCNHKFHMICLIEWKKRLKTTCPYCKGHNLSDITFYCQSCRKYKIQHHFQSPTSVPRNHMIPKFFLSFASQEKKLKCLHCRQLGSQNPQCMTRNFDSVKGSEQYISNKTSRNRQPVQITIKQSRSSQQKQSQAESENIGVGEPLTGNRLLFKIDY